MNVLEAGAFLKKIPESDNNSQHSAFFQEFLVSLIVCVRIFGHCIAFTLTGGQGLEVKSVAIIDDSTAVCRSARAILENAGHSVFTASNTYDGLSLVLSTKIDVVLCDIRIPPISGFDYCRLLKRCSLTRAIPVIFISSQHGAMDKARARLVGGIKFVDKPFSGTELLLAIRTAVET